MRNSKDRTIQKKRVNKANKIARTERSRKQRIANKHRREEIHAINPDMKVIVMNQKTFDEWGTEVKIVDGHIKAVEPADFDSAVEEYKEVVNNEIVIEKIETRNKSAFRRLTDKLRRSK